MTAAADISVLVIEDEPEIRKFLKAILSTPRLPARLRRDRRRKV